MAQVFNKSFQPCWPKPVHEAPSFGLPPLPVSTTPVVNASVGLEEQTKASRESLLEEPGIWPIISHRVSQVSFWDREEATRNRALQWMKLILLENLECSSLGRSLVNDILAFQSEDVLVRTIQDVFASWATATLRKRSKLFLKLKISVTLQVMECYQSLSRWPTTSCWNSAAHRLAHHNALGRP